MPRIFRLPESKSEEVGGNGQPWLKGFHQSLRLPSVMHDAGLATSTTLFIGTRQDISSESGRDRGLSRRAVSGQATFLTPSRLHHGSFQTSPEIPRVPANADGWVCGAGLFCFRCFICNYADTFSQSGHFLMRSKNCRNGVQSLKDMED